MPDATCSVDGCPRPTRSAKADLCNTHYFRRYRNGTTGPAQKPEHYMPLCVPCHKRHDLEIIANGQPLPIG